MVLLERIFSTTDFSRLRTAFIARARLESGRVADAKVWLDSQGYEEVDVPDGIQLTGDGREVVHAHGRAWALRPEVHKARLSLAFANSNPIPEENTKSVVGTESLSPLSCPKCGDALQHSTVCPKCAAGKLGYRHRYTCVCGGVDFVSKEKL